MKPDRQPEDATGLPADVAGKSAEQLDYILAMIDPDELEATTAQRAYPAGAAFALREQAKLTATNQEIQNGPTGSLALSFAEVTCADMAGWYGVGDYRVASGSRKSVSTHVASVAAAYCATRSTNSPLRR